MEDTLSKEEEKALRELNKSAEKDKKDRNKEEKNGEAKKEEKKTASKQASSEAKKSTRAAAAKKTSSKRASAKKKSDEKNREIIAEAVSIALICVCLLLIFGLFNGGGIIGQKMGGFMKGFFGFGAYIIPVSLIGVCLYMIFSKKKVISAPKAIMSVVVFLIVIAFMHIVHMDPDLKFESFGLFSRQMFKDGNYYNGGLLGAYIGTGLCKAIGRVFSVLFLIMGFICIGVLLTGISFFGIVKKLWEGFSSFFTFEKEQPSQEQPDSDRAENIENTREEKDEINAEKTQSGIMVRAKNRLASFFNGIKEKNKNTAEDAADDDKIRRDIREKIIAERREQRLRYEEEMAREEEKKKIYRELPKPTIINISPNLKAKPEKKLEIALDRVVAADRENIEPARSRRVETDLPEFIKKREKYEYEKFLERGKAEPEIAAKEPKINGLDYLRTEVKNSLKRENPYPQGGENDSYDSYDSIERGIYPQNDESGGLEKPVIDVSGIGAEWRQEEEINYDASYETVEEQREETAQYFQEYADYSNSLYDAAYNNCQQQSESESCDEQYKSEGAEEGFNETGYAQEGYGGGDYDNEAYSNEARGCAESENYDEKYESGYIEGYAEEYFNQTEYTQDDNTPLRDGLGCQGNALYTKEENAAQGDIPPWQDTPLQKETKPHEQYINQNRIQQQHFNQQNPNVSFGDNGGAQQKQPTVVKKSEYVFPKIEFLGINPTVKDNENSRLELLENSKKLVSTLESFSIKSEVKEISKGPAVTRYELSIAPGIKVSKILGLADNLALSLAATSIRIEAPIPGKSAVGIEIPNKTTTSVYLSEVVGSERFKKFDSKLAFGLGKDIAGNVVVTDIADMPHMLIAGATGAGKSVCINTLITSILYKASPEEVRLIMVDPKVVELSVYNGIPHLLIPVVTEADKAANALNWAVHEMTERYEKLAQTGTRNIKGYNRVLEEKGEKKLPQIVIIIDELADLMMAASKEVESAICRLAQLARAAGIHLIIATQRPSVDVITGLIKANIPSRIAFAVSSSTDSRTIIDSGGAEKLLGKGDMLFKSRNMIKPQRIQGAFVTDSEIEKIVTYLKENNPAEYDREVITKIESMKADDGSGGSEGGYGTDELTDEVISFVVRSGKCSTSLVQRKFKIGYNRAARIVEELEDRGIIGPENGSKPREVLMDKYQMEEYFTRNAGC